MILGAASGFANGYLGKTGWNINASYSFANGFGAGVDYGFGVDKDKGGFGPQIGASWSEREGFGVSAGVGYFAPGGAWSATMGVKTTQRGGNTYSANVSYGTGIHDTYLGLGMNYNTQTGSYGGNLSLTHAPGGLNPNMVSNSLGNSVTAGMNWTNGQGFNAYGDFQYWNDSWGAAPQSLNDLFNTPGDINPRSNGSSPATPEAARRNLLGDIVDGVGSWASRMWGSAVDGVQRLFGGDNDETDIGFCFVAGTLVKVQKGYKKIEDIEIGDLVFAFNEQTNSKDFKAVSRLFRNTTDTLIHIILENGTEIETTEGHPFYVPGIGFINAVELTLDHKLVNSKDEIVRIKKISKEKAQGTKTYNFEVEEFHTYYVSDREVLVHNESIKPPSKSTKKYDETINGVIEELTLKEKSTIDFTKDAIKTLFGIFGNDYIKAALTLNDMDDLATKVKEVDDGKVGKTVTGSIMEDTVQLLGAERDNLSIQKREKIESLDNEAMDYLNNGGRISDPEYRQIQEKIKKVEAETSAKQNEITETRRALMNQIYQYNQGKGTFAVFGTYSTIEKSLSLVQSDVLSEKRGAILLESNNARTFTNMYYLAKIQGYGDMSDISSGLGSGGSRATELGALQAAFHKYMMSHYDNKKTKTHP